VSSVRDAMSLPRGQTTSMMCARDTARDRFVNSNRAKRNSFGVSKTRTSAKLTLNSDALNRYAEMLGGGRTNRAAARQHLNAGGQFDAADRFRDAIVGAGFQARDHVGLALARRDQHNGKLRRELPDPFDDFRADHVARFIGGDQQIECVVPHPIQQHGRGGEEMAKMAVQDKRPADECGVLNVRVDDGDSHDFRRCLAR
jgi:hypothetical protein